MKQYERNKNMNNQIRRQIKLGVLFYTPADRNKLTFFYDNFIIYINHKYHPDEACKKTLP